MLAKRFINLALLSVITNGLPLWFKGTRDQMIQDVLSNSFCFRYPNAPGDLRFLGSRVIVVGPLGPSGH